jgi:hypothetical protein
VKKKKKGQSKNHFAAPTSDWQNFVVRVPQDAVINEEKEAYLKNKILTNGGWGEITIEGVKIR